MCSSELYHYEGKVLATIGTGRWKTGGNGQLVIILAWPLPSCCFMFTWKKAGMKGVPLSSKIYIGGTYD